MIRGAALQEQEPKSFPAELDPHMENLPKVSSARPGQARLRLSGFHSLLNPTKTSLVLKSSCPSGSLPCTSIPLIAHSFLWPSQQSCSQIPNNFLIHEEPLSQCWELFAHPWKSGMVCALPQWHPCHEQPGLPWQSPVPPELQG